MTLGSRFIKSTLGTCFPLPVYQRMFYGNRLLNQRSYLTALVRLGVCHVPNKIVPMQHCQSDIRLVRLGYLLLHATMKEKKNIYRAFFENDNVSVCVQKHQTFSDVRSLKVLLLIPLK